MLLTAAKARIRPAEFWEMTPVELSICIEGYMEDKAAELKQQITVAYLGAAWHRAKKMPRLETVLNKIDNTGHKIKRKKQTPEEMYAVAEAMTRKLSKRGE